MSEHFTMKNLPESERPYEKYLLHGEESLSDAELLAIILKSGTKDANSLDIARGILSGNHNNLLNLYDLSYRDLMHFPGIGQVKAIQLKAVAELSKRIAKTKSGYCLRMDNPKSISDYYPEYGNVTLLDNDRDGEYEYIIIDAYELFTAEIVDADKEIIYDFSNNKKQLFVLCK